MNILVKRKVKTDKSTVGELSIDGKFQCYTLEDVVRSEKIHGKTAIPTGTYDVIINASTRFKRDLPLLLNVPGFTGIRIHTGNTAADTEGCILVGQARGIDQIFESRKAFSTLFEKMKATTNIKITIE